MKIANIRINKKIMPDEAKVNPYLYYMGKTNSTPWNDEPPGAWLVVGVKASRHCADITLEHNPHGWNVRKYPPITIDRPPLIHKRYWHNVLGVQTLQCKKCLSIYPKSAHAFPLDETNGGGIAQCTHACKTCIEKEIAKQLQDRKDNPGKYINLCTKWGLT